MQSDRKLFYRHSGVAMLRAAAVPLDHGPGWWPDLTDAESCRTWLGDVWALPGFADEVWHSSRVLAANVEALCSGHSIKDREVRRAATSVVRYLLRATGRPTPFGLFAGVAPVGLADAAAVRWGSGHRPVARVDTQWLADVVTQLESVPGVLHLLDVQFSNLAVRRGSRIETPFGPERSSVRYTRAIQVVHEATRSPVRFEALAGRLLALFPGGSPQRLHDLLAGLILQGFLITSLRAPYTVVDPLLHVIDRLGEVGAESVAAAAPTLQRLETIHRALRQHNDPTAATNDRQHRDEIIGWMGELSTAGRSPLSLDLLLDCDIRIPTHVADEMEHAASVMLRLSRRPAGDAAWQDYHTRFIHRYGTGVLVPVTDVTDLDAGHGFPASYLGTIAADPVEPPTRRDQQLLALAVQAIADGTGEVVLTEDTIAALTEDNGFDELHFPAHVELAARIHATSREALTRGDYTLMVTPARSAGTLTCRFSMLSTGFGLEDVYRSLPVSVEGALAVQMSFPPAYPHAENVCRIPAYLPHMMSFGEHQAPNAATDVMLDDLAILATGKRLYLASISRNQILEPQVLHALAMQKQPPPLVRFLAHLARGFGALWTEVDWGPHYHDLAYLPRLRYRRSIIAPARWRLTATALPGKAAPAVEWEQALKRWRQLWHCPDVVELRDDDRTLRIDFTVPAHATIIRQHLDKHADATFTETAGTAEGFGWVDGHAHEIAIPFVTCRPAAPSPLHGLPPVNTNRHGHTPGARDSQWLQLKLHTHPERMDEIISGHLPALLQTIDPDPRLWFVRYHSPLETPHLRVRLHAPDPHQRTSYTTAAGQWAHQLRQMGLVGHVVVDTYYPEVGRYGVGPVMRAAEEVFAADSRLVTAILRHRETIGIPPVAMAAISMAAIVEGFLGDIGDAMDWLAAQEPITGPTIDRDIARQVLDLARPGTGWTLPPWSVDITATWAARNDALAAYTCRIPDDVARSHVLESLLHMHHNRAIGIDPDSERDSRRLARQAAVAWVNRRVRT
jgi:thiopeptide-type bacteriocin biosynthesis protein